MLTEPVYLTNRKSFPEMQNKEKVFAVFSEIWGWDNLAVS